MIVRSYRKEEQGKQENEGKTTEKRRIKKDRKRRDKEENEQRSCCLLSNWDLGWGESSSRDFSEELQQPHDLGETLDPLGKITSRGRREE